MPQLARSSRHLDSPWEGDHGRVFATMSQLFSRPSEGRFRRGARIIVSPVTPIAARAFRIISCVG